MSGGGGCPCTVRSHLGEGVAGLGVYCLVMFSALWIIVTWGPPGGQNEWLMGRHDWKYHHYATSMRGGNDKKTFQSNAYSPSYIVNTFEHVWEGGLFLYGEVQVEQVWTCLGVSTWPVTDQWYHWQWSHGEVPTEWKNTYDWKHHLPATSMAGGKCSFKITQNQIQNPTRITKISL